jgi:hypothetical protein
MTTFTPPSSGTPPQFVVAVKSAVVGALQNTFHAANYPDPILQGMSVSMEYPGEVEQYPGVWVGFSFRDMQSVGLGNPIFLDEGPPARRYQLWNFGGTVTLTIVALTSKERDAISDKIIQMYAFHELNQHTGSFRAYLDAYPYIYMNINNDILRTEGESTTVGAPWQPDVIVYENTLVFDVAGQFASQLPTGELIKLDEIRGLPYHKEETSTKVDDNNGEWYEYGYVLEDYDPNIHPLGPMSYVGGKWYLGKDVDPYYPG